MQYVSREYFVFIKYAIHHIMDTLYLKIIICVLWNTYENIVEHVHVARALY
jgi:hypothetical protein